MLALDDTHWTDLTHAYGSASDIPGLLRQLAEATGPTGDYDSEPWYSLWSSLCHQGDVFDASYAAVPHIVAIACRASGPVDFGFFQLPAAIEISRANGKGPELPSDLASAYRDAVPRLADCVAIHRHENWDGTMLQSAMSALAVAKGHPRMGEAIMNLDDVLIEKLIALDFSG